MQGIPSGFALSAISNYLTANGTSPQAVGSFIAIVGLPWAAQFVWGPIIDRFQGSVMGRRKPWVLFSQLLACIASLGILLVDNPTEQLSLLSMTFFIHSVFASVQDASVDAMAISIIPESERGRINACMRAGFLCGIAFGSAALSHIIHRYGFQAAALTQSLALLGMFCLTFFVKEKQEDALLPTIAAKTAQAARIRWQDHSLRWLFRELMRGLVSRRSLLLFSAIALVYICQSVFIRVFSMHLIRELHWQDESVSVFSGTYGTIATLLVTLIGGITADKIGARRLLILVMLVNSSFLLIFNLLGDLWMDESVATTGLFLTSILDPGISVSALPLLMALCRKGVEGSQFTAYMALVNLSDIIGAYLSGQALGLFSTPTIGLTCGLLVMAAMVVVWRLHQPNQKVHVRATTSGTV